MIERAFKAYDIRGAYPDLLDEDLAHRIGRATAVFLSARRVLIGHDMRASSKPLSQSLIAGFRRQGTDVVFIGDASSPLIYFAGRDFDASVSVTASHNPPPDNGMKICGPHALPIGSANGLLDIRDLAAANDFTDADRQGSLSYDSPRDLFIDFSLESASFSRPFRVVVDAGNGIGGLDYQALSKRIAQRPLPLQIIELYCDPDDSFPHHLPNPLDASTLVDLQKAVLREKADLGIALDGDGDRCFFVDEKGTVLPADLITALVANDVLSRNPGRTILHDLRSSRIVAEEVTRAGGHPVESRVGHAFIKKAMREKNGIFAGELSGHFYFERSSYAENTLLALFSVLNILDRKGIPLSEAVAPLDRYASSGEVNRRVENSRRVIEKLAEAHADGRCSHLDGLKVDYEHWWFNVRPSNTEPYLRLVVEARTAAEMEEHRDRILAMIDSFGGSG